MNADFKLNGLQIETERLLLRQFKREDLANFYELEIACSGIVRGFIINPCNIYFTMDRKVTRFLRTVLKIYEVPKEKIEETIDFVKQFDMKVLAKEVLDSLFDYLISNT